MSLSRRRVRNVTLGRTRNRDARRVARRIGQVLTADIGGRGDDHDATFDRLGDRAMQDRVVEVARDADVDHVRASPPCRVHRERDGLGRRDSLRVHDSVQSESSIRGDCANQRPYRLSMAKGIVGDSVVVLVDSVPSLSHVRVAIDEVVGVVHGGVRPVPTVQNSDVLAFTRGPRMGGFYRDLLETGLAVELRETWRNIGEIDDGPLRGDSHASGLVENVARSETRGQHESNDGECVHDAVPFIRGFLTGAINTEAAALPVDTADYQQPVRSGRCSALGLSKGSRPSLTTSDTLSRAARLREAVWSTIHNDTKLALVHAREFLAAATESGDAALQASAMHAVGCCRLALGQASSAEKWLARAAFQARELGHPDAAAHSEVTRIQALLLMGRTLPALAEARRLSRREARRGNVVGEARALVTEANLHAQLQRHPRALRLLERAREKLANRDDTGPQIAALEINRANVLTVLGRPADARAAYRFVREWAEMARQPRLVCEALYNEAVLWVKSGCWQQAYDRFEEVRPRYAELGDGRGSTLVDLDQAELFLRLGLNDDAVDLATSAVEGASTLGLLYEHGRARLVRGSALLTRGVEEALHDFRRASELFHEEGNGAWQALAHVAMGGGRLRENEEFHALDHATEAFELIRKSPAAFVTLQTRELQAQCYVRLGMHPEALAASRAAARALRATPVPWIREVVWLTRGRIHRARGNRAQARSAFERAAQAVELSRALVLSEPLGFSFLRGRAEVFEELLDLDLDSPDPGRREAAFSVAARALAPRLPDASPIHLQFDDPTVSDLATSSDHRIDATAVKLQGLYQRLAPTDPGTSTPNPEQRVELDAQLRREERRLLRLLREHPGTRAPGRFEVLNRSQTSVRAARARLGAGTALIEYFRAKDRIGAFVVTRQSFEVHRDLAGADSVDRAILKLRFQLERGLVAATRNDGSRAAESSRSVSAMLQGLAESILWPLLSRCTLESPHWIIVPSGSMASIPFVALPLAAGGVCADRDLSLLADRSQLFEMGKRQPSSDGAIVVLGTRRADLPEIATELAAIERSVPGARIHEGAAATLDRFRTEGTRARLIHVACHAAFRPDNPYYSALELADGWLPAWEVSRLRFAADLAVLSACESGRLHSSPGDRSVGLGRALLTAGVRNLVVSLWRVRDEVAAFRAQCFYRHLVSGATCRVAQLRAVREVRDRFPHPWDWANAALIGQGESTFRSASAPGVP